MINKLHYNKNNPKDIIIVQSVEYEDGLKKVFFRRRDKIFKLPIEMFEKNFKALNGYE